MAKIIKAEIVRRPRSAKRQLQNRIDALVRERVDEILSQRDGEMMLDGDFAPKAVRTDIFRRTMLFERRKWPLYFAKWGCRGCRTKRKAHTGQGYCAACYLRIFQRLKALRRDWDFEHPQDAPEIDAIDESIRTAKRVFAAEDDQS